MIELKFQITPSPLPYNVLRGECVAVYTAYNPDAVEVFRCVPNSIWSSEYKCWEVRKSMVSVFVRKMRSVCNKLGYTCKFFLSKDLAVETVENADLSDFNFITPPYQYQKEGVEFCVKHKHCFIGDEPGCLSGGTIVQVYWVDSKEMETCSLERLFINVSVDPQAHVLIKCLVNGVFAYLPIDEVIYSGIRPTLRIFLDNGASVELTQDHKVLSRDGWVSAEALSVGDHLLCSTEELSSFSPAFYSSELHYPDTVAYSMPVGVRDSSIPQFHAVTMVQNSDIQEVYDIKLRGEVHNFVANGVVVHNCGKSLANDSLLYYKEGPKPIGNAKVGDKVFGCDGQVHEIIGVYPQGVLDTYKITFYDNTSVECSLDHIWRVKTGYNGKYKDVTTRDILNSKKVLTTDFIEFYWGPSHGISNPEYCIPKCAPIEHHEQVDESVFEFTNEFCNRVEFSSVNTRINYVLYVLSECSKRDNIQIDEKGRFFFCQFKTSELVGSCGRIHMDNFKKIINSLGGSFYTDVLQDARILPSYVDVITFPKFVSDHIRLRSKKRFNLVNYSALNLTDSYESTLRNLVKSVFGKQYDCVGIRSVEKLDSKECTCIKIDSEDSLFLTTDYIVTHNTKQLIDYARYLKYKHGIKHALVICGVNGNKFNWLDEISIHSELTGHILGSRYSRRTGKLNPGNLSTTLADLRCPPEDFFYIINIEKLRGGRVKRKRGQRRSISEFPVAQGIQKLINDGEIGLVAVDEIHKVKQPTALQAQALLWLNCERQVGMSGTLVVNSPLDLYVPFKWMGFECRDYYKFQNRYAIKDHWGSVIGFQHAQEMIDVLSVYQIRRLRKDILELPPKIHTNEYVELSEAEWRYYRLIQEGLAAIVDRGELIQYESKHKIKSDLFDNFIGETNPLTLSLRLRQVTADTSLISDAPVPSSKMDRMEEIVNSVVESGGKCIIFSNWSSVTSIAKNRLSKYAPAYITGAIKDSVRAEEIRRFQEDPTCKIIIGTSTALGTGFTLTAANTVIFLDEPWTKATKVQCEDRAYRVGTSTSVNVITLIAKNTVDEHVHSIVENKGAIADLIVDGVVNPNKRKQFINLLLGRDQYANHEQKKRAVSTLVDAIIAEDKDLEVL